MAKLRQSSFRRILVSKILLLSVPVLLIGEIVAYNKARSSFIETARRNLTESSILKGEKILDTIAALKSNLLLARQTKVLETGSPQEMQEFLNELERQQPTQIECIQLRNPQNSNIIASTCGDIITEKLKLPSSGDGVDVEAILPAKVGTTGKRDKRNQLQLLLSAPVFDPEGKLLYSLSVQLALHEQIKNKRGSLRGSTVVIASDGTILAHPLPDRVGSNIQQQPDADRLQDIVKNAIAGRKNYIHLSFQSGKELIAGYTAIENPITKHKEDKWIILAVTSMDNALYGLGQIQLILIALTVGLIGVSVLVSLYLARHLALPVEELRDYAINLHLSQEVKPVPHNFNIREFNQLAQALNQMVERLKVWAEELDIAWKEAKTANQVKSHFLATTSHELRNPLNIIINCVRVVKDDLCDNREEEIEFLNRVDETAIHLLGIINDLLDISKIEAGKLSVVTQPVDLAQVVKEVINLQSVNVQQSGLQLKFEPANQPIPVHADAAKLKQVLINIIGNATKFTEQGSITVTADIQHLEEKSVAVVKIQDTGVGIDPAQQDKLFRPFVMVDSTNTGKFGGTGLGLAISRNLIELMKGTITLESPGINQGTTITITLPLIDAELLHKVGEAMNQGSYTTLSNGKPPGGDLHTSLPFK